MAARIRFRSSLRARSRRRAVADLRSFALANRRPEYGIAHRVRRHVVLWAAGSELPGEILAKRAQRRKSVLRPDVRLPRGVRHRAHRDLEVASFRPLSAG